MTKERARELERASEVASRLGVERQTVVEWYKAGRIPAEIVLPGRRPRFYWPDVEAALREAAE